MVMRKWILAIAVGIMLTGCEKVVFEDRDGESANGNLTLSVSVSNGTTRSSDEQLGDACGRLNVAVFNRAGEKVKAVAQTAGDAGYGVVRLSLPDGSYTVVVVGHNGTGSATITNAEKVTFPNNKTTDTFCFYGEIDVTGEEQQMDIMLERVVSMIRFVLDDNGDSMGIASLKFYYTGGSSTLSPKTGYGCVQSKQTEYRAWNEEGIYELYTMPHSKSDIITKMTITAYDAGDNVVGEWVLENIPVTMNRVSEYAGDLFGGGGGGTWSMTGNITVNTEWGGVDEYKF